MRTRCPQANSFVGTLRLIWLAFALTYLSPRAYAQNWVSISLPVDVSDWGNLYVDTNANTMFVGGFNQVFPGQRGFFRTNGSGWDTVGYFDQRVNSAVHYHDTLIVGGGFYTSQDDSVRACAFFNGTDWLAYGLFNGAVNKLRVLDDELYVVGSFSMVDGQPADGIAKRVDGHWEPVGDFGVVPDPYLFDVIKYHGDLICCGNMEILGEDYIDIFIYQNGEWGPLGGGLLGGMSGGWEMTIYHDELILAGGFYLSAGNAGQCIMRWNGNIWQPLGVGTTDNTDSYSSAPNIHALCVHNDLLFVGGGFSYAGHVPAKGIAVWDGSTWCGLGSDLGLVHDIVFFHDTLYAMCGNNWIDGEYNTGGVKYLHTTYSDTCSLPTAVDDLGEQITATSMILENGTARIHGLADGNSSYIIRDVAGKVVRSEQLVSSAGISSPISMEHLTAGVYVLQLENHPAIRFVYP